ncbi:divalent ion tolerance protein [Basidiobolus meristosporus CBS 931.73]|uniref:Divalent ion tolerance protein n=1 Tax=Basidiobolus meristosporus CBS 931.73 TaxID=1314790 RepID=A0A1Y1WTL1_9FUNG|nr:divalent ion tolerance protein [Basidiobolus meristosporus CBS 931.73]|eukprot:ORX76782.1 divalent ion tolerance protein [Basidiobolus meristosporus CBS 931.73]
MSKCVPDIRAIFVTCPNEEIAKKLSRGLLTEKLVACINVIPKVTSMYWWDGEIEESTEVLLMMKTAADKVENVIQHVNENHPYDVPEVISIKIDDGSKEYMNWVTDSVRKPQLQ